jgi:tRNA dimethylallyltransferase
MHDFPPLTQCWYLTGATASGKTGLALELAERLGAEIISLDSMAVYRGMDVGTAKPREADRQRIPHHLLDLVDPNEEFSLSEYLTAAHRQVHDLQRQGKPALFVGGTPLYLKSLLRGACEGPPADPEFREAVLAEIAEVGIEPLRQRLAHVDPLSAAKLHENDVRRMIRALEVYKVTGRPISHYQLQFDTLPSERAQRVFVLAWNRDALHDRINDRVDAMFAEGFVDEVRQLLDRFGEFSRTAIQGVGYREVVEHLRGQHDLGSTRSLVKIRTRRFARRQETWFRGMNECRWITRNPSRSWQEALQQILHPDS